MTWWKLFANQIILRKSELGSCVLEGSIISKMHNVTMFQQTIVRWFSGNLTNCTLWRRPVSFSKAINDWTECPSVKHERSLVEFVVQFEVGGFLMYYVLFSNIWSWYPYRKDAICVFCSGWNLSPVFKCYAHRVGEQVSGVFWSNHSVGCRNAPDREFTQGNRINQISPQKTSSIFGMHIPETESETVRGNMAPKRRFLKWRDQTCAGRPKPPF